MGHTPGPWKAKVDKQCTWIDGTPAYHVHVVPELPRWQFDRVAHCFWDRGRDDKKAEGTECRDNARLMAAAPELLEELRALVLAVDFQPSHRNGYGDCVQQREFGTCDVCTAVVAAKAVIVKAEAK